MFGRPWLHTLVFAGAISLALLVAGGLTRHPLAPVVTGLGVFIAALSGWLGALVFSGDGHVGSRLPVFRSQWQVPLYAGLSVFLTTALGAYLKSRGAETVCGSWPLCDGALAGGLTGTLAAHLAHRVAAALAGALLLYTFLYVFRRHRSRPALMGLTGGAAVLYLSQVILGAKAALHGLSAADSFLHLAVAALLTALLMAIAAAGYYAPTVPAIAGGAVAVALPAPLSVGKLLRAYLDATKPRILILLLVTGYAAMWVAAGGAPPLGLTLVTMLGLGMSCGAANAINMWYDTDIDGIMSRTQKRPIPSGRLTPEQVLSFGILTGVLSFVLLAAAVNLLTAWLSLGGLLFYVLIYTMWLKRSTVQNIVIGGAAGAAPPLVGWAAVTGGMSWAAVVMFLIIFVWTPPHFWALALFRNEDYRRAKIPMMPVVRGEMQTKWQILGYSLLLLPTVAALYLTGTVGQLYLWSALALTVAYVGSCAALFFERLPAKKWAVRSFAWSIFWLGLVFLMACVDAVKA